MLLSYFLLSLLVLLAGCGGSIFPQKDKLQQSVYYSPAESESGYTYVPLDPFPVDRKPGPDCEGLAKLDRKTLLEALPDNAVRMLTEKFDASGTLTYGASKVSGGEETYRVTIDYIYSDTMNRKLYISKLVTPSAAATNFNSVPQPMVVPIGSPPSFPYVPGSEEYKISSEIPLFSPNMEPGEVDRQVAIFKKDYSEYNIPVYVGIGLRVSANIYGAKAHANISGLGVIGAEAEANNLKGSLVIQTLGVNGKSVAAALPIQSELNRTTAQNAIVAVGTIKALLHSEGTWVAPRVVGLYLPFPGGKALVNAIISELSKNARPWYYTCFGRDISPSK